LGRHMRRRRRPAEPAELWQAAQNAAGTWVVLDAEGHEPLRHPEELVQVTHVHLAASAPALRAILVQLTRRMERLVEHSWQHRVDRRLLERAHAELIATRPPFPLVERLRAVEQQSLYLEAA